MENVNVDSEFVFDNMNNDLFAGLPKIKIKMILIDDYLKILSISINREVEKRMSKISKYLKKAGMIEHLKVIIAEYPDGKREIINGNTRAACWEKDPSLRPDYVLAEIRYYDDQEKAKTEYYAVDSIASVENGSDKFTGAFRALDIFDSLAHPKIKNGHITNAMKDFMKIWPNDNIPNTPDHGRNEFYIQATEIIKEELIELDNILSNMEHIAKQPLKNTKFITLAIMFLKKYPPETPEHNKVVEGIQRIFKGTIFWKGDDDRQTDGISHIIYELKNPNSNWIPDGATRSKTIEQMDFLIYCFMKWVNNIEMKSARRYSLEKSVYLNFFNDIS